MIRVSVRVRRKKMSLENEKKLHFRHLSKNKITPLNNMSFVVLHKKEPHRKSSGNTALGHLNESLL